MNSKIVLVLVLLIGCGGSKVDTKSETEPKPKTIPDVQIVEVEGPPLYVVIHKTTKLRLAPRNNAPFVQFISSKEWGELEDKMKDDAADLAKREKEEEKARKEAERKKAEKLRKQKKKKKKRKKKKKKKLTKKQREKQRIREDLKREKEKARKEAVLRKRGEKINSRRRRALTKYAPDGYWISFIPFRKVGESSGWVELETVTSDEDPEHCNHHALGRLGAMKARFFVRAAEIAPVVNRQVRVSDPYGTEIALLPGVGLEERGDGRYRAFVDGHVLDVDLHSDSVGDTYQPIRRYEAAMTDTIFKEIAVANKQLRLNSKTRLPFNPHVPMYVSKTLSVGRKFYATLETGCSQLSVRVRERDIEPAGPRKAQRLGSDEKVAEPPFIQPGATLFTKKGTEIGRATSSIGLVNFDGERCGEVRIWGGNRGSRAIEICTDVDRIVAQ